MKFVQSFADKMGRAGEGGGRRENIYDKANNV